MLTAYHEQQRTAIIEQGLTSHQTHYRSYRGQVFTGQMTQHTVSKHWRKTVS